jgi:transcriptional regulator with XRE-family HTH domain
MSDLKTVRHNRSEAVEEVNAEEEALRQKLGDRIVAFRTRLRVSQTALARQLGIGRTRLTKWEKGSHSPSLGQLLRLSVALRTTVDELLGGPNPEGGSLTREQRTRLSGCVQALLKVLEGGAAASRKPGGRSRTR